MTTHYPQPSSHSHSLYFSKDADSSGQHIGNVPSTRTCSQQLDHLLDAARAAKPSMNRRAREDLQAKTRKLMLELETPNETMHRMSFGIWEPLSVLIGIDLGIFGRLVERSPQTKAELAEATKCEDVLMGRILATLVSFNVLEQIDDTTFAATPVCATLADPAYQAAIESSVRFSFIGWTALPDFLRDNDYRNPSSSTNTALAKAYGRANGATVFDIMHDHPARDSFNTFMMSRNAGHADWTTFYPVQQRIANGAKPGAEQVLFVDCGGGLGHQAARFRAQFPDVPGRVVVQDLPQGLPAKAPEGVEIMEHDLFTAQPIRGARVYYLRWMTHQWDRKILFTMLGGLRDAMEPGYSRLLLHEVSIPSQNPPAYMTTIDMTMMTIGGQERTGPQHRKLVEAVGLKFVAIHDPGDDFSESIVEAEVA